MRDIALDTPLFEIIGARAPALRKLEKLGVKTAGDLLWHFPTRYEDFSKIYSIAELEPGQQATIQGIVEEVELRRSWRKSMSIVHAVVSDGSGSIRAVWFNQPYIANVLKTGRTANFAGRVSVSDEGELYLSHPMYEIVRSAAPAGEDSADYETKHTARLVPIYPETRGLTSRGIRFAVQILLKHKLALKEWIPSQVLESLHFPDINEAIRAVHFPNRAEDAGAARKRFSFEELFLLQIVNVRQKLRLAAEQASAMPADIAWVKEILAKLPFDLTPSQKRSLWEIIQDMERPHPMNRLLQGDVGSGKTVVAAIAAMIAAKNGYETAFMAPTEILARQHFETMKKLFAHIGSAERSAQEKQPAIGLLTGSGGVIFYENDVEARVSKPEFHKKTSAGEVPIVFGTHALIQKAVSFKALGLVVVDEQHRFGVRERAELSGKQAEKQERGAALPHFLSMSATPIPRTLMLSVFGDLDLSLITELPAGRKEIQTKIVMPLERNATYELVRKEIKNGRQAFVICPRIEPGEETEPTSPAQMKTLELKSVKEEFERLSKKVFPDLRLAMLHGQMKPKEKEEIMKKFEQREYDILVATSVVEVGVDVPNATIMMIEGVERFGLAQLYQFRGRVGRGEHQSYCFLMASGKNDAGTANARMKAIVAAKNGFELAEKDLELRGPGQFFGDVQTGLPDVAMEALRDPALVKDSREAAVAVIEESPTLAKYPLLKSKIESFQKKIHAE